jgi:hypothetical protein
MGSFQQLIFWAEKKIPFSFIFLEIAFENSAPKQTHSPNLVWKFGVELLSPFSIECKSIEQAGKEVLSTPNKEYSL